MSKQPTNTDPDTKPPPSPLSELSIYNSPHSEYMSFKHNEYKCSKYGESLCFSRLLPIVKIKRKAASEIFTKTIEDLTSYFNDIRKMLDDKKVELVEMARSPDYQPARLAFIATSGVLGFVGGRRLGTFKDSVLRGLLGSAFAMIATGTLCYPNETDEAVRNIFYKGAQGVLSIYSFYANDTYQLKPPHVCQYEWPKKLEAKVKQSKCPKDIQCTLYR